MPKFKVFLDSMVYDPIEVEASNKEEAIDIAFQELKENMFPEAVAEPIDEEAEDSIDLL